MTPTVPPRHHDIADDLRRQITTGRIKPGERLPSESGLAGQYQVSTATLRSALAVLQGEGLVEKIHGKGNFVRHRLRKIMYVGGWGTLDPWTAAETALRVKGRATAIEASGHLAALLRVPNGSPLTEFLSISYQGGVPAQPGPHLRPSRAGAHRTPRRRPATRADRDELRCAEPSVVGDPGDGLRPPPDAG